MTDQADDAMVFMRGVMDLAGSLNLPPPAAILIFGGIAGLLAQHDEIRGVRPFDESKDEAIRLFALALERCDIGKTVKH